MVDLNRVQEELQQDVQSVLDWCEQMYQKNFASFFTRQRELYRRLESKSRPITDDELEDILTSIPLELFTAAEKLSELNISQEVIKMRNKKDLIDKREASVAKTQTKREEEANYLMLENKLMETVYSSVIERVEKEISFSRELIMGAKKIWDRRRQTEGVNPVGTNITPAALVPEHKTYYEQMQSSKGQPIYGG